MRWKPIIYGDDYNNDPPEEEQMSFDNYTVFCRCGEVIDMQWSEMSCECPRCSRIVRRD